MKRCNYCRKLHIFYVPPRHWWRYYWTNRNAGSLRISMPTDESSLSRSIFTNYHQTGWGVYCHPCWPKYVRESEREYRSH